MELDRFYYITSLPALGELGSVPPLGFAELMEHLVDDRQRSELVGMLLHQWRRIAAEDSERPAAVAGES